jgi:hypothetical protein
MTGSVVLARKWHSEGARMLHKYPAVKEFFAEVLVRVDLSCP